MKNKCILFVLLTILLYGCNDELPQITPEVESAEKAKIISHGIPKEQALENLRDFLEVFNQGETTRGNDNTTPIFKSVEVIRKSNITRSVAQNAPNVDSLIYIVNFENNEGYAILAADDRISSPLIFLGDTGNIPGESFIPNLPPNYQRPIFPEYPLTGPGTFYIDNDTVGDLFMNPNTFDLYDETVMDHYVGDFIYSSSDSTQSPVTDLVFDYVDRQINDYGDGDYDDIGGVAYEGDDDDNENQFVTIVSTKVGERIKYKVDNILTFAYAWHQDSPFNDLCQTVREFFKLDDINTAAAGCVPLSIAKIMTHFEYPNPMNVYGNTINWNQLKHDFRNSGADDAARLLKYIGAECMTIYFSQGSFTFPSLAAYFLHRKGYRDVDYVDYNDVLVKQMLDKRHPVFVCSVPKLGTFNYDFTQSHAWNLDGYRMYEITYSRDYYQNGILLKTQTETESRFMVHCDFGWSGYCNGYFTSGVFDLSGNDIIFDDTELGNCGKTTNYNWYLKIISYE